MQFLKITNVIKNKIIRRSVKLVKKEINITKKQNLKLKK